MALRETTTETIRREPIRDRDFVMPFGRFKGISIDDLIHAKPDYLKWLHDNSETFELHADLLDEVEEAMKTWRT